MKVKLTLIGLFINYIFSIGQNGNAASLTTKVSRNTDTIDLISLAFSFNGKGVNEDIQKLKSIAYSIEVHDTNRMAAFLNIAKFYIDINNDTSQIGRAHV